MACSREIIKKITQYVRFRVPRTNEKDSYYTENGNNLIRISNHCTWMKVWDNMLKENPKWQGKTIISVVFEDNGNTFSEENLFSLGYRRRPIKIREYVYNSSSLSKQDINLIIKSLQNLTKSNNFIDLSKKGIPNNRISVCPDYNNIETSSDGIPSKGGYNGADLVPESKQNNKQNINYNRNMNKNRIRLTESQLHRVIKESVKKVIKEQKQTISAEQAKNFLENLIGKQSLEDNLYECAFNIIQRAISEIENKYTVVDVDGMPYDGSDGVEWYDEIRDDLIQDVMTKIQNCGY